MILATIYHPPPTTNHLLHATHYLPSATLLPVPATRHPPPISGTCNSVSLWVKYPEAYMWTFSQVRLGVHFKACSGVCLRASWELPWEQTVQQAGSVFSSPIESILKACLGMYSHVGWECDIQCNWECTWKCTQECAWECLESQLGSIQTIRLRVYVQVQLGVSWELTWECTVQQAGNVPSSAIESLLRA
jgi:hypothetical protein